MDHFDLLGEGGFGGRLTTLSRHGSGDATDDLEVGVDDGNDRCFVWSRLKGIVPPL